MDPEALDRDIAAHVAELVAIRRDLHGHPELGFEEHRTAALVASRLRQVGLEPRTGVGGTGVVADLTGSADGPTILLRADMDGLPVEERSDAAYRSQEPGRMHACGHDGHVAMLLVAAAALARQRDGLRGRIRFLFQPAEELPPGGALAVIEAGALDGVDAALGLHLWNPLTVGTIGLRAGAIMAAHDQLDILLRGAGGHGGMPESARDPLVGMSYLVAALQTVVARGVSPLETAVVTIGTAQAGSAFNVIPDEARLSGTVRSLGAATRTRVHERIREVTEGQAAAFGLAAQVELTEFCPALENDPALAAVVERVATRVVGPENVRPDFRTTASEDFAFIARAVPSCFLFIGSGRDDGERTYPHHHPSFDIDERSLAIGARMLVHITTALLEDEGLPSRLVEAAGAAARGGAIGGGAIGGGAIGGGAIG